MPLNTDLKSIIGQVFAFISDEEFTINITYRQWVSEDYNTDTGETTTTYNDVSGITAVGARFALKELDNTIVVQTDMKFIIPATSLPGIARANEKDVILDIDKNEQWNVQKSMGVPGESVHLIHVRRA